MTSVAPAQNGAFIHIPTKTPRVHGLPTPPHARRRAGHPLARGRLGKQNAVRAILGRLVSSSRENMRILEDAVRQAYSFDSFQTMCMLAAAIFTRVTHRLTHSSHPWWHCVHPPCGTVVALLLLHPYAQSRRRSRL